MHRVPRARSGGAKEYMTTAIASSGGRCRSVVLTERYARPPRVARTHHRRSHSKLSETQFREGFSAPRYPPNVPPDHPTLDLRPERGSPPPTPPGTVAGPGKVGGGGGTLGPKVGGGGTLQPRCAIRAARWRGPSWHRGAHSPRVGDRPMAVGGRRPGHPSDDRAP